MEWYDLLATFPRLVARYSKGKKFAPSKPVWGVLLTIGLGGLYLMTLFPRHLFWIYWVAPLLLYGSVLSLLGIWTPLTPAKRGDWSAVLLSALGCLVNGFFWELWNHGSVYFRPDQPPTNPNFWKYDIPYVGGFYLFSEMPLVGYSGYLIFGNLCWVMWIVGCAFFGVHSPRFPRRHRQKKESPLALT